MQCYSELVPPSGVTHSISLPFVSAEVVNLVIARTSLLQIFSLNQINNGQDTKLVLVAEFSLSGTVTSLGRVKVSTSKSGGDALIVALRDAKLSLVEWDPAQHSISTISIHYYENYELNSAPWSPDLRDCVSHLTVDPSSRCAAFNFGLTNLAIIPFHQSADDLAMDDFDDLDEEKPEDAANSHANDETDTHKTPYRPSFVLPLTALDPGLLHPVDMTFLHEYREPTIGILYSTAARSENMAFERKDVTIYAVYTLDLEQKASTTLQSVSKLPNDLYKIVALPPPVGGALLVGGNELIHIDQGGKANAIGVNEFAKECSSFSMADHSAYQMRLEGCQLEHLSTANGDMMLMFVNGDMAVLSFRLDGRSVSGLSLQRIEAAHIRSLVSGSTSTMSQLGLGRLFIGSQESDSVLLGTARKASQLKRQSSRAQLAPNGATGSDSDDDSTGDDDDEDDFYADAGAPAANGHASDLAGLNGSTFRVLDRLVSVAPLRDVAFGRPGKRKRDAADDHASVLKQETELELATACGQGSGGGLAYFSRRIAPSLVQRSRHTGLKGVWSFNTQRTDPTASQKDIRDPYDDHVIMSQSTEHSEGRSSLLTLSHDGLQLKDGTDFDESAGGTIAVGSLAHSNHTVQVTAIEIRVYDDAFGLSQIFPIVDEESDTTARAVSATFAASFVLVMKDDSTMSLLKADENGELDEIDLPSELTQSRVLSARLFLDNTDFFNTTRYHDKSTAASRIILSVLTVDGVFSMHPLQDLRIQIFQYHGLHFLPSKLSQGSLIPKHWKSSDHLAEALIAAIGDEYDQQPHLVVRNAVGDVVLYKPYAIDGKVGVYEFRKVNAKNADTHEGMFANDITGSRLLPTQQLQLLPNLGGYAAVFVPGVCPFLIVKTASSMAQIYNIGTGAIKFARPYHDISCPNGMIYLDDDDFLCTAQLPADLVLGISDWVVRKAEMNQDVSSIAYFEPTGSYVFATNHALEFQLPQDDEWHQEWKTEDAAFFPTNWQSSLNLLSPDGHSITNQHHFDPSERVMCIKCLDLEVSEETHERKELIVVGTAIVKGENVVTRGMIYIFDVVDVVPQPDVPETDLKLKLIMSEDVKGAVTAISAVGSQGFLLAAQGQKCMVRGMKEDMTILPVAFMDMRYYVNVTKELKGTGLCLLGDAVSGLWLVGYSEEPYKLQLLGRDLDNAEAITAEFLPDGKQLFIITSDGHGEFRVMQYDPEDPKTERGAKLLLRSTFNTGSYPTTMTLVPRTPVASEVSGLSSDDGMDADDHDYARQLILITTQEGGIALITPLSDNAYRRLSTLQNILITNLEHPCGLNPRAYRQVETDGIGGRGMIDGNLVRRWVDQSSQHKSSTADKVGGTVWDVRSDLEAVGGAGLGYL